MKARAGTPSLNGFGPPPQQQQQPEYGDKSSQHQSQDRQDLSILRKPIQTSITGFLETVKAYESGTKEIRALLTHECDIIYECKVCRNIFRSLANFISHKRIYCREPFSNAQHFHFRHDPSGIDRDVTTIVQAEQDYATSKTTVIGTSGGKSSVKDLSSVVERLLRREHASRPVPNIIPKTESVQPVSNQIQNQNQDSVVLQFDRVKTNDCAVFQTVRRDKSDEIQTMSKDSIEKDVNEIHKMQANRVTTVGPDGRVVPEQLADKLTCDICKMQFETEKTLRIHIKKNHVSSTYVYPCPSCTQTFIKPWAVMRHLSNDHKKSLRRIRQMRETILRRRTRISEIQVKGPSRELARLQLEERERAEAQQRTTWPDNYNGIGGALTIHAPSSKSSKSSSNSTSKHTSLCSYCGKTFERRAALSTHLKSCPAKTSSSSVSGSTRGSSSTSTRQSDAALLENDESNSNSTDSFMAMLNRERAIQAKILEQEKQIAAAVAAAAAQAETESLENTTKAAQKETETQSACDIFNQNVKMEPSTELPRNKRKRSHVCKADLSTALRSDDDHDEVIFSWDDHMDTSVNVSEIIKVEPDLNNLNNGNDAKFPINIIKKPKLSLDDECGATECTICERKFANLSNLRRHVAMFHYREKKFGCTLCQFRAYRKVDVLFHLTTVHEMSGDKEESSQFVRMIEVDKNKFSVEREKAVADAQLKMQQRIPAAMQIDAEGGIDFSSPNINNSNKEEPEIKREVNSIIPFVNKDDLHQALLFNDIISSDPNFIIKHEITPDNTMDLMLQEVETSPAFFEPSQPKLNTSLPTITVAKRRGRPKGSTLTARKSLPINVTPTPYPGLTLPPAKPNKQSKLIRHSSSNSSSSEETGLSTRRPVRNRIKAVNKDFVYDMSNLLKTEDNFNSFLSRGPKRKSTPGNPTNLPNEEQQQYVIAEEESAVPTNVLSDSSNPMRQIKGAALVMAQISVMSNRACYNQPPEMPIERPIVPAKIIGLRRSFGSSELREPSSIQKVTPLNRRASNEQIFADTLTRKVQAFESGKNNNEKTGKLSQPENISQRSVLVSGKEYTTQNGHSLIRVNYPHDITPATNFNGSTNAPLANVKPYRIPINNNIHLTTAATLSTPSVNEKNTPKRISVIDRLAEIHTRKLQESIQLMHISDCTENQ